jgi:hypothetical protein
MHSMLRRSVICSVVFVLEVAVPLAQALDGGATVFSNAATLELGPEVDSGEACHCRCARQH